MKTTNWVADIDKSETPFLCSEIRQTFHQNTS